MAVDPDAPATEEEPTEGETDVCQPPEPNNSTDIEDKIRENILAMQVTAEYPGREGKERILETYLNLIYYGNGSYGIKAAAANYFGLTNLADMTISQAAFLAALPQAPSFLDPYQNPNSTLENPRTGRADALRERDLVLGAMREEGYITAAEEAEARATTWVQMNPSRLTSILQRAALQLPRPIRGRAHPRDPPGRHRRRPRGPHRRLSHHHHPRLPLQQEAKRLVAKWVDTLRGFNVNNSALVAIDSATGEIVAYVGSVDYYNREDPRVQGQFDVAGLGTAPAGIGLQADHVRLGLPVPRRDRVDDARRCDDRVRHDRPDLVPANERRHQGARPGAGDGRAALLAEHPVGADAVPWSARRRRPTSPQSLGIASADTSWPRTRASPWRSDRCRST